MEGLYETELVKNCLIPMSDRVTLAADLYRPIVDRPIPALVSFAAYHKDADYGARYGDLMRGMAQAGYGCLAVDIRGTGDSGGFTVSTKGKRERRDYYEAVEWAASQEWCDGKVGVWGKSYAGTAALFTAAENPPHLAAVAAFHAGGRVWTDGEWFVAGRFRLLESGAQFGPRMACWNLMPPAYRDPRGRWLAVWREHLESNVPWLITALDMGSSGDAEDEPYTAIMGRIQVPVYLWSGWRDILPKEMVETYQALKVPKKLTVGPWMHELPDAGHAGRINYLHELRRWFDHWLRGEDTGIMNEPPVCVWVQQAETWYFEDDFPPPEVKDWALYPGPGGTLSECLPSASNSGADSFVYDATVGAYSAYRDARGLDVDQRPDEIGGVTYTTQPLGENVEICGAPEAVILYGSTAVETLLVAKLCDVAPDGRSLLITQGWFDVDWQSGGRSTWGEVSEGPSRVRLRMIPTGYVVRAGHRLRLFVSGSNFPLLLPSRGPGEITILWGEASPSSVRLPIRPARGEVRKPAFLTPSEVRHPPTAAPTWRIEQDPAEKTTTVRIGFGQSLGLDGGEGPATVSYSHRCSATASQREPSQWTAHAESWGRWENQDERVKVHAVMAFRPVGIDLSVSITLNDVQYWDRRWSRSWSEPKWKL